MVGIFRVPQVQENEEGWGPSAVPDHLKDVPFAPYSKSERLGRASDWTQAGYHNKYGRYNNRESSVGAAVFQFSMAEEAEDSYQLVDNKPTTRKPYGNRRFQQPNRALQRRDDKDPMKEQMERKARLQQAHQMKKNRAWQMSFQRGRFNQGPGILYSCSVDVRPEWTVLEQVEFTGLQKLSVPSPSPVDVRACGKLHFYEKAFDRITPKTAVKVARTNRVFRNVTASEDPILKEMASKGEAQVFATDAVLATLMATTRSVYSWDVVVTRRGDQIFFDKRDGSAIDLYTCNETAPEQIPEDKDTINGVQQLSIEATAVNQSFSQQVLPGGESRDLGNPNPFELKDEAGELASCGYVYRKFDLPGAGKGATPVSVAVRCTVDGLVRYKGEEQRLAIRALNEFDTRATDWRQKLESQRGAVLAIELKNNANKLAKWTAQALLAGAEMMKIGYITRAHPRDNSSHVLLGTQMQKPRDFAGQMNLKMDNLWGVTREIIDLCMKRGDGKYLIVRDPNKQLLRLYEIPENAFEEGGYSADDVATMDEEAPRAAPQASAGNDI